MAFTSLGVVLISTMTFVLGTFPEFQPEEETGMPTEFPVVMTIMDMVDNIAVGFFLIEYVVRRPQRPNIENKGHLGHSDNWTTFFFKVRFVCAPRKLKFFVGPMNLVDLFAILPFFLDLIIGGLQVKDYNKYQLSGSSEQKFFPYFFNLLMATVLCT